MKLRPLPDTVVHLKTQAEYDEYMQMCEDAGWVWKSYTKPKDSVFYPDRSHVQIQNEMIRLDKCYASEKNLTILTLPELKAKLGGKEKPDTWTLDAPIYRRGSDWIREDKMCIAGKEYTFDEVCEQEAKFRAFRRAHSRYFPKAK